MIKRLNEITDGKTFLEKSIELARWLYGHTANYEMSSESRLDLQMELSKLIAMIEGANNYYLDVKKESKSRTRKRSIKEGIEQVDGYAVQIHDMGKGYIHLLLFNDESTAEEVLESLEYLESAEDIDEEMFYAEVDYNVDIADDVVNEIDWRREVDNNDVWTASDDTKYKIIGSVDLWLYW